jgi:NAD(P)-dependent dehydrogenase (short-subunit alcohol dehydrogenase family)
MTDPTNPYKHLYENPNGVGDQRPTALQIVRDQGAVGTYAGKVALVTGGTNGIGLETARALHATGVDVFITARDATKGDKVRQDILSTSEGKGCFKIIMMDMDSLESVRNAAKNFLSQSDKLNILINNAGILP